MSFYIAIIAYLLSVSIALMLLATGKSLPKDKLMMAGLLHAMLLLAFLASLVLKGEGNTFNYFFLAYICSGVLLSGLFLRSDFHLLLKIYFASFTLSLAVFLFSPTMLVHFMLTMKFSDVHGKNFHLAGNYYLEPQNVVKEGSKEIVYKLIQKRGLYRLGIDRDISFPGSLDSVKVLGINGEHSMLIRAYYSNKTYVSAESDSTDIELSLRKQKYGDVEYKL